MDHDSVKIYSGTDLVEICSLILFRLVVRFGRAWNDGAAELAYLRIFHR